MNRMWNAKFLVHTACTVALAALGQAAQAQSLVVTADPGQSHVGFTTKDNVHGIQGFFHVKEGRFVIEPASHKISGSMSVDVASGDSGSHMRDNNMHRQVLESDKYPLATFTADEMEGDLVRAGDSHVRVHGVLRLHGADHLMWLDFTVHIQGDAVTAKTAFPIPYIDWGMKDMSNFMFHMDKNVSVAVELIGHIILLP